MLSPYKTTGESYSLNFPLEYWSEQCCQLAKEVHIVGTTDSFDIFHTFRNFHLIQNKPALIELE